uniref:Uncharacterized protein n=1 Tax=Anguilla anguilla TaxID=7936 RepID=A0A0E9WSY6_ANGAN
MSDKTMYLTISLQNFFHLLLYTGISACPYIEYLRSIYCISACTGVREQLYFIIVLLAGFFLC